MTAWRLAAPVALIMFNRPQLAARVFDRVAAAQPPLLYLICDGPRPDRAGEAEAVAAARALARRVDWKCELVTDYSDVNLGLRARVRSGLDRVLREHDRMIVLEDDCEPDPSFFRYADELLERFAADPRIFTISGDNFQPRRGAPEYSYYFSRYVHVWGWATWRRSWQRCDPAMRDWPRLRAEGWLERTLPAPRQARYWREVFDRTHAGEIQTWAHQMTFACWREAALNVLPNLNLVANLGFGAGATNTRSGSALLQRPAESMPFPLRHPAEVAQDAHADDFTFDAILSPSLLGRMAQRLRTAAARDAG